MREERGGRGEGRGAAGLSCSPPQRRRRRKTPRESLSLSLSLSPPQLMRRHQSVGANPLSSAPPPVCFCFVPALAIHKQADTRSNLPDRTGCLSLLSFLEPCPLSPLCNYLCSLAAASGARKQSGDEKDPSAGESAGRTPARFLAGCSLDGDVR